MERLEHIPSEEAKQIENIAKLTIEQLKKRYPGEDAVRRGVHSKDHGCVMAKFKVSDSLLEHLRVGVFAEPGHEYDAWIRFSNAAVTVTADSSTRNGVTSHGSRGMAVKLLGVIGSPLLPTIGPLTQDFLMINQPVFAFSNVEDYQVLSQILLEDNDDPSRFFAERIHKQPDGKPDMTDPATLRALTTLGIVQRVRSNSLTGTPPAQPAYQTPPASPVDNRYFSGAPFLFGDDRVMKYSANPIAPVLDAVPDVSDANYLRAALHKRLTASDAKDIVFEFQVQVRTASDLSGKIDTEIEDACFQWDEKIHPFVTVGTITIPPQDFETAEQRALCESLTFTPWHGVTEHRPLGGINRLRRAVYEASTHFRHMPKEPAHL
jgi:hypothetical protein